MLSFSSALLKNLMRENFHYSLCVYKMQDARISSGINTVHLGKEVSVSVNAEESKMKYHKICNSFY